ncbi:MAG: GNAT family N-acetyltransferase [Aphanocapsa sp. GSE-SYN-MK-11-07L]|jgi:ribosomal-protein-alanine N-acetyltransferase|nr:GNAT family N-acetyltransferase [Aphanocapsa sp. GSE-SYN-MK-11-07L]
MSLGFETQRLRLKPVVENDLHTLHRIFADPYVRKYLCDDQVFSLYQIKEMLIENCQLFDQHKFGLWLIETKEQNQTIGFVGLWYFFEEPQPQLLYALLPEFTKKGYATEAANRIVEYCFDQLSYQYILASCNQPNLESSKVAAKLGMKQIEERVVNDSLLLFFKIERPIV